MNTPTRPPATFPAPTDPQVSLWFAVDCATEECESFLEGAPASRVSEAEALAMAVGKNWKMTRAGDGRLYCRECTARAAEEAACADRNEWGEWVKVPAQKGLWAAMEYRTCQCGVRHEKREQSDA